MASSFIIYDHGGLWQKGITANLIESGGEGGHYITILQFEREKVEHHRNRIERITEKRKKEERGARVEDTLFKVASIDHFLIGTRQRTECVAS